MELGCRLRARRLAGAALAAWLAAAGCGRDPVLERPAPAEGPVLRLAAGPGGPSVEVETGAFRLVLRDARGRRVAAQRLHGLRFARDGREVALGRARELARGERALELAVDTPRGEARVSLAWRDARQLSLSFEPPAPEQVTGFCDAWELAPDEAIYGLAERANDSLALFDWPPLGEIFPRKVGSLDRRGEEIEMYVRPTVAVYAPFYTSSAGYGLYVAGTLPGVYDVGRADADTLRFCFEAASAPARRRHEAHLFVGPPRDVVDAYTALTGRPFVPPDWAFRPWRWRNELEVGPPGELDGAPVNAQLAEDVSLYERLGFPAGVYLIDRPWSTGPFGFESFRWDEERFRRPRAMREALARRGWRLAVWSAAFAVGENLAEAREAGHLAPGSDLVIDLTSPAARAWWRSVHVEFARRWDVAAFKLDRGEERLPSGADDVWADGRSGREVHNDYPRLQAELYADALREARGDDFAVLMRAGYTGAQAHGVVWAGDIPGTDRGLRQAFLALGHVGFLGYPIWGSDTGGYYEFTNREVFARWLAFSAFCPIMEIGGYGTHAPWDMPTDPPWDEEMIGIYRRYTRLHEALVPYLAAFARGPGRRGVPVARVLVFDHPDDPRVRDLWDQFLVGDELLVAPLWRIGAREREVYLPEGRWEDFWEPGVVHEGPLTLRAEALLDRIPAFVRAGAEIPGRAEARGSSAAARGGAAQEGR